MNCAALLILDSTTSAFTRSRRQDQDSRRFAPRLGTFKEPPTVEENSVNGGFRFVAVSSTVVSPEIRNLDIQFYGISIVAEVTRAAWQISHVA